MIIEKTLGKLSSFDVGKRNVDRVVLTREEMSRGHQKLVTGNGITIAISLAPSEELTANEILYEDEDTVVVTDLAEEDALVIYPENSMQWGTVCFNIGNMHQQCFLSTDRIIIPYDYVMEDMLTKMGVLFNRTKVKIEGSRANFKSGHQHQHNGHSHTHEEHSHD